MENKDKQLLQIAQHLIINSAFTNDLGLFHGRMGIVLFLCHYARYSKQKLYNDYAGELIEMINEDLTVDIPVNIENGLSGIGWTIEYLITNNFMEGNTDDILTDIDERIMQYDPLRINDYSFKDGIIGIIFYVLTRLVSKNRNIKNKPFDKDYLYALFKKTDFLVSCNTLNNKSIHIVETYRNIYCNHQFKISKLLLFPFLSFEKPKDEELGLIKGWAGKGINLLSNNGTNIYF